MNPHLSAPCSNDIDSDSIRRAAVAGWLIIGLFFGGLGLWSTIAPLNGAVVTNGMVKVEGNRKSVQHLDGGIVKDLRVKEGDHVNVGDVLIVLDDTQAKAEFQVLSEQYVVLRATEVRLLTELANAGEMTIPADLANRGDDSYARSIWTGQIKQFESRRAAIDGQRKVIGEKIHQLQSQIEGAEAQVRAYNEQIQSVRSEADSVAPLVDKMLLPRPRLLQLQRTAYSLDGQAADAQANIAKFRQAIAEQELQIAQLGNDHMADITKDLREIQAKLVEVLPKLANAEAVLSRMEIRAPYAGRVVGLSVFSIGGVIQRGEKILDIVPDEDSLTVEVQVAVDEISDVHPGMKAEVHLTAYKQRIVPTIRGEVLQVSADRLTDPKTNSPYYVASVRPDVTELASLPGIRLYPGMPATVMIPTESRTAFDYIVGPLTQSFSRAFRQK
ncbi:membrane fusion protein, epimerase transport system [Enhydrobacter aerosaccus]|uniref:Membrane fusion protein (MFP) family protein n=1 Tax=Enhydrobacter aerosaccus TaxID=225324 RepID=A0A1T4JSF7_9HYPH|nr:HlyD family type I secretion periplasmic adaptor subunit [Enhydrobacter aerosaccus]SJZ33079.1 membrane fusion protein, epimerase transport system [Enhydrobacter aerosaccus]